MPENKNNNANPAASANETIGQSAQTSETNQSSDNASTNRPSSISEALKLIDTVINRDGANLRELVTSEYANLRGAIDNIAPNMGEHVSKYGTQAVDALSGYASQGITQGRKIATQVDTQVRANPWPIISGVALSALAVGFMLGKNAPAADEPSDLH